MSATQTAESTSALYTKHADTFKAAIDAIHSREFYARWIEAPSTRIYGETANEDGIAAYKGRLGKAYEGLLQDSDGNKESSEVSPFIGESLGISYPVFNSAQTYIDKANAAWPAWKKTDPKTRAGILMEALERIGHRFFEMAYATMHTTGQGFMMAFQASGPHSNDRALEAVALGLYEQTRFPGEVTWTKPMGKMEVTLQKFYKVVPVGLSLAVGCSTFPVWNTSPGVFASLVTGNPVVWKPHPGSVYPAAIFVEEVQKVLSENGFDPHVCQLAVDTADAPMTKELAENDAIKIIDYTGGNEFGNYLEGLKGKRTFTEKAGINSLVIHSTNDMKSMLQNIATSLSLYSGQMCTCPQNIYVPKQGIQVGDEAVSYEDFVGHLAAAVKGLVTHEKAGHATLGAVQNENTKARIKEAENLGAKVILESLDIANPDFPNARTASHILVEVPSDKVDVLSREMFGPIAFIVPVDSAEEGTQIARDLANQQGALTFGAYTTDKNLMDYMIDEISDTFTSVSFNFVGPIWVNQSAGFSDFHVTGGNAAGNASLTDPEYVIGRFEIVGVRIHA